MFNNKFTQTIFLLLLATSAANAGVLITQDDAAPGPASTGALAHQGISQPGQTHAVQAPDAVAQQAQADFFAVDGTSKASAARFQPLPVDVPALPSPPPIPVPEPYTGAILASGLALMALLKRKRRA